MFMVDGQAFSFKHFWNVLFFCATISLILHQKEREKITHEHDLIFWTNIATQYSFTLRILPFPAMISLLVF